MFLLFKSSRLGKKKNQLVYMLFNLLNKLIMKNFYFILFLILSLLTLEKANSQQWHETDKTLPVPYLNNASDQYGSSVSIDGNYAIVGASGFNDMQGSAYILHYNGTSWETLAKLTASDWASNDHFGHSVSISGDVALVGAYKDNVNGSYSGSAYIFKKPETGWVDTTETAKLTASNGAYYDHFGYSVSISGDVVLIGAIYKYDNGSAYIFEKPETGWVDMTETAWLTASDAAYDDDYFGWSVSISGNVALIGAHNDDDNGSESGSAYIFEKPVSGWVDTTETAKLTASDGASYDYFGYSVSISGDVALIGAYGDADYGSYSGSAYIFEKPVSGWVDTTETAKLTASDGAINDRFGCSVSLFGDVAIVGARDDADNGLYSGSAYVFEQPVTGWVNITETAKLVTLDGEYGDNFGYSVSLSGDVALIGTHLDDDNGKNSGSAYIFEKPVTGWVNMTETIKILPQPYSNNINHYYGSSVFIDGDYAIIGAYGFNGFDDYIGCAYILHYNGTNWETLARLTASDGASGDYFGYSVSISGDVAIVGAYQDDDNGLESGSAYIFEKPVSGWVDMTETAKLIASDGESNDYFGYSVSISGDVALIGAYRDDDNGIACGSAYIFEKPVTGWVNSTETAKLLASDGPGYYDHFGYSVSISGHVAIIGAPGNYSNTGSAYIFEKPETGWVDTSETASFNAVGSDFGCSVSISGDVALVGAYNGRIAGVYEKPPTGWAGWIPNTAKLVASDNESYFGRSVSISGDVALIGAYDNGAYIFKKPANGWVDTTETQKFISQEEEINDYFGYSVSIFEDMALISAYRDDDNGPISGSAYFFKNFYLFEEEAAICNGEIYSWHESNYTATGIYYDSLLSINDVDSIYVLDLIVNPVYNFSEDTTICGTFIWHGNEYNTSGIYYDSITTTNGCDSVYELTLIVNSVYLIEEAVAICEGETYFTQGELQTEPGTYYDTLQTVFGCDSVIVTNLTVNAVFETVVEPAICEGENYFAQGELQTEPGTYYDTLQTVFGCDSVIVTNLTVNAVFETVVEPVICEGESYFAQGEYQTLSGTYYDTLQTVLGCDSVIITNLTVNAVYETPVSSDICAGESYDFFGTELSESGDYSHTLTSINSCDSVIALTLTVYPLPIVNLGNDTTIYDTDLILLDAGEGFAGYEWNDGSTSQTLEVNGTLLDTISYTYSVTVTDNNSCSNSDTIVITIKSSTDILSINTNPAIVKLYPNPTTGLINLSIENIGKDKIIVNIVSIDGKVIYTKEFENIADKIIEELDLTNHRKGIYLIKVFNNKTVKTERLILD